MKNFAIISELTHLFDLKIDKNSTFIKRGTNKLSEVKKYLLSIGRTNEEA